MGRNPRKDAMIQLKERVEQTCEWLISNSPLHQSSTARLLELLRFQVRIKGNWKVFSSPCQCMENPPPFPQQTLKGLKGTNHSTSFVSHICLAHGKLRILNSAKVSDLVTTFHKQEEETYRNCHSSIYYYATITDKTMANSSPSLLRLGAGGQVRGSGGNGCEGCSGPEQGIRHL